MMYDFRLFIARLGDDGAPEAYAIVQGTAVGLDPIERLFGAAWYLDTGDFDGLFFAGNGAEGIFTVTTPIRNIDDDDCLLKTYSQGSPDQDELVVTAEEATDVQSDICGLSSLLSTSCNIIGSESLPSTIARFNLEISKLYHADTDAYYRAVELCPDQVHYERDFCNRLCRCCSTASSRR